jgi:hypothetical protein
MGSLYKLREKGRMIEIDRREVRGRADVFVLTDSFSMRDAQLE